MALNTNNKIFIMYIAIQNKKKYLYFLKNKLRSESKPRLKLD